MFSEAGNFQFSIIFYVSLAHARILFSATSTHFQVFFFSFSSCSSTVYTCTVQNVYFWKVLKESFHQHNLNQPSLIISGAKGRSDQLSHFNRRSKIIHNYFFDINELKDSTMLESFSYIRVNSFVFLTGVIIVIYIS